MIKPLPNRVLVKVLPRYDGISQKLNLVIVDKKKHFEGARRGAVVGVGAGVHGVGVGDIVWFNGAQGKSFDENSAGYNDGTGMRVIAASKLLAVEEAVAA